MTHRPLVSVIVPAKDQAPYVSDALASLALQFDDPAVLEVLVVDDGSTDGTGELAASFADRLPGLRVLRNESTAGLATARNQGLDAAGGAYIAFLDGDDWLAPGHLAACLDSLRRLDVDFVRTDHVTVEEGRRTLVRAPQARRGTALDPRESILPADARAMVDYPYAWAGLFQRRVAERGLLRFPDGLRTAEDRPWIWRLHLQADSFAVVNAPGVIYRRGVPTSLTQVCDERQLDFLPSFAMIFDLVQTVEDPTLFWPKVARQFCAVACHHLGRDNWPGDLREPLRAGITQALAAMPQEACQGALDTLDAERRAALLPLLPGGPGRFTGSVPAESVPAAPAGVSP
ncbi:glycosyl transferase [Zafaria cholistanensis]|uniref:Glycosyl transferase n=1 Tax=Zafaria cholistanensis TaxID=1682741 RepID=A0A5A7NSY7_9MICC|nr:glycosyltransferase family 2 protein [Zafaria cholistanensis]GER23007.1 glycosyl transferase [Zafaria cholistanensis]